VVAFISQGMCEPNTPLKEIFLTRRKILSGFSFYFKVEVSSIAKQAMFERNS